MMRHLFIAASVTNRMDSQAEDNRNELDRGAWDRRRTGDRLSLQLSKKSAYQLNGRSACDPPRALEPHVRSTTHELPGQQLNARAAAR